MPNFINFKSIVTEPPKFKDTIFVGQELVCSKRFSHYTHQIIKISKSVITTKDIKTNEIHKFNRSGKSTSHNGAFLTRVPKEELNKIDKNYDSLKTFLENPNI